MAIEAGQQLLHYRVIEKIGEGGMGVVWKAEDTTLHRQVAIKVLPAVVAQDPDRLGRFDREAKLLASLNHTSIAGVYGLHEHDGVRFIAMELVPGEDLAQVISRGALAPDRAMDVALQVADALEVAHEQGVIHRDLKPANRWVAYDSNESGGWETYVRPFPAGGGKWQISTGGGGNATWSADGKVLYYCSGSTLMGVEFSTSGDTFLPNAPQIVIEGHLPEPGGFRNYDLTRDGRVIATVDRDEQAGEPTRTLLVLNWFHELRERAR